MRHILMILGLLLALAALPGTAGACKVVGTDGKPVPPDEYRRMCDEAGARIEGVSLETFRRRHARPSELSPAGVAAAAGRGYGAALCAGAGAGGLALVSRRRARRPGGSR